MIKLKINNIPINIIYTGIEYSKKCIYDAEYTFFIIDRQNKISEFKTVMTFCEKVPILPKINLKQNQTIISIQIKLIKYLSDTFIK